MTIVYYVALITLVGGAIQLISGYSLSPSGFAHRQEDYKRYWISILIQVVIAIGFLIYTALQMPTV